MKLLAVLGIALLMGSSVTLLSSNPSFEPDIVYVDDDNTTGIEDGSIFHPYNTISEGLAAVAVGGTVHVLGGTYVETLEINKSVALLGESPVTTEVRSTTTWPGFRIAAANVTLSGFSFKETSLLLDHASDVRIAGNEFVRASLSVEDSQQLSVLHNQFYLCGISIKGLHEGDISENAIVGGSESIYVERGEDVQIESNTIWNETESMFKTGVRVFHSQNITILNNSIWNLFTGIQLSDDSNVVIQDNSVATTYIGIYAQESNHITLRANVLKKDRYAMDLRTSTNLTVEGNSFSGNHNNLLVLVTKGAVIFHNNFNESVWGVRDDNTTFNSWHHPVLLEGNYWSNYDGLDDGSGTGKHAIAGDGIGDTLIPHPNPGYDYYPLMRPWRLNQPPVADAGPDQTVNVGDIVQLDGSGSFDPDETAIFGTSVRVDDDPSGADQHPGSVAVDSIGNIHVAWNDRRNGNSDIYYSKSVDGGTTFETNIRVNDVFPQDQGLPSIAVDIDRNIHIVWEDRRNGNWDIYYANSTDGGSSFGTSVRVDDDIGGADQWEPSIAIDDDSNIHVVWQDIRNGNWDMYYANSSDGGISFGMNVRVDDDTSGADQWDPRIAVDKNGNISVAWDDHRNLNRDIYYSKSIDGGVSFGTNVRVDDDTTGGYQRGPRIAVDDNGGIHVVWQDDRNGVDDIYYTKSIDGGASFGKNVRVDDDVNGTGQWDPSIAVDKNGNIHASWVDIRNLNTDIYHSRSIDGGASFGTNVRVDDDVSGASQWAQSMTVDNIGNVHVVWADRRNGNDDIYYARGRTFPLTFDWDFHDGSPHSSEMNPTHVYDVAGTYDVLLTVTDAGGAQDSDVCVVTVLSTSVLLDIEPNTLNLKSKGRWITAYLSTNASVYDIDVSSILLQDALAPERYNYQGDVLMLKFDRQDFKDTVEVGGSVQVKISGKWEDGSDFEAGDYIRVIDSARR